MATLEQVRKTQARKLVFCWEYQKAMGCKTCGIKDPRILQFHHRDPAKKSFSIGQKAKSRSWYGLKEEILKCDVMCVNCHRALHEGEENYDLLSEEEIQATKQQAKDIATTYLAHRATSS